MSSASSDSLASSRTTLPARLLPSPAATFQNIESQSGSHDLCIDCEGLLHCILIGSTLSDSRWETINSNQTTLTFYRNHLDGFVATLQRSAEDGCKLCIEYIRQLRSLESFDPNETYCLFQWSRKLPRCELQLALGDVRRFAMHVSHWTRPITINFYTRQQMDTRYSNGSPSSLVLNSQIPRLYVLPEQHSGSEASNARAHQWLDDCLNRHEDCVRPPSKLPKRVLDLGKSLQIEKVKVYVTKGEHARYATLSYSWGQAKRLLTTRETLKSHCQGIDLDKVPQTLRDALYIAKSLGFRYIWIDALCIIQKDKLDFAEQVAALTEIYGNSTLNISASSAKNSDDGILKELPDNGTLLGNFVQRDFQILPNTVWAGPRPQTLDIEEKFISSRGWVFQERLVSPATLHYTDEGMVWECAVGAKVEHDQNVFNTKWKSNWKATMNGKIQDQAQPGAAGESEPEKYHCFESWYDWICAYSERDLHDSDDKFPAIAGVAKTFASAFGLTYAAGLWTEDMISGMMWRRHNRKETLTRYEKYVAPSWSWASVHGRLEYRNVQMVDSKAGPRLKILGVKIDEEHPGKFERVLYGEIAAEGFLQEVIVDKSLHPGVRKKTFQECGIAEGFVNNRNVLVMLDVLSHSLNNEFTCLCLRLGSFDSCGRLGDMFLLLRRDQANKSKFRRIGLAETDPWEDGSIPILDSGSLEHPRPSRIILV